MATTYSAAQHNIGNAADTNAIRQIQDMIEDLPGTEAPLPSLIGYGSPVLIGPGKKYEWPQEDWKQNYVQINNGAGYTTSDTSLVVDDGAQLQVGQILKNGNELIRVTAISTNTLTVTRGFAGTAAAAITDDQQLKLLLGAYLDTDSAPRSPHRVGDIEYNFPFQTWFKFDQTDMSTAVPSYLRDKSQTALERAKTKLLSNDVMRQFQNTLMYGERIAPSSSQQGYMRGISNYISTHVTSSAGVLTATMLTNLMDDIRRDSRKTSFTAIGNMDMKRIWDAVFNTYFDRQGTPDTNAVGVTVDKFTTSVGTVDFLVVDDLEDGELYLLDLSDIKILPLEITGGLGTGWVEMTRGPVETGSRLTEWHYSFIGTLQVGYERRHGKITGITTTTSAYANYV